MKGSGKFHSYDSDQHDGGRTTVIEETSIYELDLNSQGPKLRIKQTTKEIIKYIEFEY